MRSGQEEAAGLLSVSIRADGRAGQAAVDAVAATAAALIKGSLPGAPAHPSTFAPFTKTTPVLTVSKTCADVCLLHEGLLTLPVKSCRFLDP